MIEKVDLKEEEKELGIKIQLSNFGKDTRVHLTANQFVPSE